MGKLSIGQKASLKKKVTGEDVQAFSRLSMDTNPVHLDEDYASQTVFQKRIAHGFLVGSYISAVIANELPGPGTIYLHQEMNFKKPVFWDDEIEAEIEIIEEIKPTIFKLRTICRNQNNEVVIDGYAVVKKVEK